MPEKWFDKDHEKKRLACKVPEDLEFKTKNEILSEMINELISSGKFKGKYVGVDSAFGRDRHFLSSLPEGLIFFADVPKNTQVFRERPVMVMPEYAGRGRRPKFPVPSIKSVSVEDIANDDRIPWEDVVLSNGSKGPILAKDKCIRVVEAGDNGPGNDIWLYIRKLEDGSLKFSICNESLNASKEDIRKPALMRWTIEHCFRECKKFLGLDHYESRSWVAWRRHILVTLIAHLYLIKMRRRFSITPDSPGPTLYVESPVPLEEYIEATEIYQKTQTLNHPKISVSPKGKQQILTIGLMRDLISSFIQKTGVLFDTLKQRLKQGFYSYKSFCKSKIEMMLKQKQTS
jgi:hypothetical protein